jgi:hypothetical protein
MGPSFIAGLDVVAELACHADRILSWVPDGGVAGNGLFPAER